MRKLRRNEWAAVAILCTIALWVLLKVAGQIQKFAETAATVLPEWFPLFNLFFLPLIVAVLFLRLTRHTWSVVCLFAVILFSLSMLYVSGQRYLWATAAMNIFLLAEIYWIMPRLRKRLERGLYRRRVERD